MLSSFQCCLLQDIIQKVKQSTNYASLLEYDQLLKLQRNKEAFVGFSKLLCGQMIGFSKLFNITVVILDNVT